MALTSVATAALMPPRRSVSPPEKEGEMGGEGEKLTPQTNSCPCKAGEGILQQLIPRLDRSLEVLPNSSVIPDSHSSP